MQTHRSKTQELYQRLNDKGHFDFKAKLDLWERFNNFHRPHGARNEMAPYEALREAIARK